MQMHCVTLNNSCRLFRLEQRVLFFPPWSASNLSRSVCSDKEVNSNTHMHSPLLSPAFCWMRLCWRSVCVLLLHDFIPTSCAHSYCIRAIFISHALQRVFLLRRQMFARKSMKLSTAGTHTGRRITAKQTFHLACLLISHITWDWLMAAFYMPFVSIVW
jgi:hypothetical protein